MTLDDLKKLATSSILITLDRIISPRLIRVLYPIGIAGLALWTINHFFVSFSLGFGEGLWGILEIVVFGLIGLISLRIACEALLVFFKANESAAETAAQPRMQTSLIDEVRDAIEQLAEDDDIKVVSMSSAKSEDTKKVPVRKTPVRRTAKRTAPAASKK